MTDYIFDSGKILLGQDVENCMREVIKTIKKELPDHLHTKEVIEVILEDTKKSLNSTKLEL